MVLGTGVTRPTQRLDSRGVRIGAPITVRFADGSATPTGNQINSSLVGGKIGGLIDLVLGLGLFEGGLDFFVEGLASFERGVPPQSVVLNVPAEGAGAAGFKRHLQGLLGGLAAGDVDRSADGR